MKVKVIIDRPIHSVHPNHPDLVYEVNYGYVEGVFAPDKEEQDCYVLGVDVPIDSFEGELIAIIKRHDDVEEKWVVANKKYSKDEIKKLTNFVEQYFEIEIIVL